MNEKDKAIKELQEQVKLLQSEVEYLQNILDDAKISYAMKTSTEARNLDKTINELCQGERIIFEKITPRHANFFYSMFKGRSDVYSKRSKLKKGGFAYFTACNNFWHYGVCPKADGKTIKCQDCTNRNWKKVSQSILMEHLIGLNEDCTDVIGLYPMFPDETCNFLVFDFDNHDTTNQTNETEGANIDDEWIEEVNAMREICEENLVEVLVERSRSGKGAHIWIFFEEPILASVARRFGTSLLTKGAESVNLKNFKSYDRMLPAQDHMPEGGKSGGAGLGNLIALPLQRQSLKHGNSAFIDKEWNAYSNQWLQLQSIKKISKKFVEEKIKEWGADGILGTLSDDMSGEEAAKIVEKEKPWERKRLQFDINDIDGTLKLTLANQIFIDINNIKARMQNQIRRLAAFSNPEFYKKQAMGFSTQGIARIIACGCDVDNYICIPRGCEEKLVEKLTESGIHYKIDDCREKGKSIYVDFKGELYPEQKKAASKMLERENGILGAATAFGKTAVGAYLVSERKVNTLILVHNTEIMKNWVEDFEKFLLINEELPEYKTSKGRVKRRKNVIGRLYAGHNSLTGIIDVAMISSLGKKGEINQLVKDYGMVIMDECHHAGAQTSEEVLKEVSARYVYGLTATPKRDDGQEQKIFMQFGPIRYRYTAKDKAAQQGIEHYIYPRFTRLVHVNGENIKINDAYKMVIASDIRNSQIATDVEECLAKGRTPLVLTKFKEHAKLLYGLIEGKADHIFLLQGGRSTKERDSIREKMKAVPEEDTIVLIAIGQYIGEGFNYPRLDTMMLTTPIAWQ